MTYHIVVRGAGRGLKAEARPPILTENLLRSGTMYALFRARAHVLFRQKRSAPLSKSVLYANAYQAIPKPR